MNIYVSHSSKYDYINNIYKPLKESKLNNEHNIFLPHEGDNQKIYAKDIIANSDLIIAEVSLPATGQGIELGIATTLNKKILCIYKEGEKISSSLNYITSNFIEYKDSVDMIEKISVFINNMK